MARTPPPGNVYITLSVSKETKEAVKALAERDKRTISAEVEHLVEQASGKGK